MLLGILHAKGIYVDLYPLIVTNTSVVTQSKVFDKSCVRTPLEIAVCLCLQQMADSFAVAAGISWMHTDTGGRHYEIQNPQQPRLREILLNGPNDLRALSEGICL